MASTPVEIQLPSGVTATLSLYPLDSDTLANSGGADTLTEPTNAKGFYTATVTEALSGVYRAKVLVGSTVLATGFVNMADDTSTYRVVDDYLVAANLEASESGSGGDVVTLTVNDAGSNPIADCAVWITSDSDGDTVVAGTKYTDQAGLVAFNLDAGTTYYCWRQKSGVNFTNPSTFVAVAD